MYMYMCMCIRWMFKSTYTVLYYFILKYTVAQLVQHLPRTQNITGSSPARGSSSFSLEKKSCLRVSLLAFALSL